MPIKVRCSGCQTVLNAPSKAAGKRIKCPKCQQPISVPDPSAPKAKKKSGQKVAKAAPSDELDILMRLDMDRLEDTEVKLCPNCSQQVGDEDTLCSQCGIDLATGQLPPEERRKREREGVDPAEFTSKAWSNANTFVPANKGLAIRTAIYGIINTCLAAGCAFLMAWCIRIPPKTFWTFVTLVAVMVIPGWPWYLHTVVVSNTLERRKKLKRVNFDFFLSAALGIKAIAWTAFFGLPFWGLAALLWQMQIPVGAAVAAGLAVPYLLLALPVAMSHMVMPATYPGWLPNKVWPAVFRHFKSVMVWVGLLLVTYIPVFALVGVTVGVYGNQLVGVYQDIQLNLLINEANYLGGRDEKELAGMVEGWPEYYETISEPKEGEGAQIDWVQQIVPAILFVLISFAFGFSSLFNMRTNGLFTLVFKNELDLISMIKETKWVSPAEREARKEKKRQEREARKAARKKAKEGPEKDPLDDIPQE